MSDFIQVTINKPLYGTMAYIRKKYIKEAKRQKKFLRITIPEGSMIVSAKQWLKNAKVMEKEFLIPGHPMKLFGNFVKVEKTDDVDAGLYRKNMQRLADIWKGKYGHVLGKS